MSDATTESSTPEGARTAGALLRQARQAQGMHIAALAQQIHQIASITASSIDHAHLRRDVAAQNLVEDVNVDAAELLLKGHAHGVPAFYERNRGG